MQIEIQLKKDFKEEDLPPKINWDYFLSRTALSKLTNFNIFEHEIINHLSLKNSPTTLVSLSHTKGAAVAAICENNKAISIGIDIENKKRIVKKGYERFFLNMEDSHEDLLQLWGEKEAAFKAISPLVGSKIIFDKTLVLKDIWVKKQNFGLVNSKSPLGFFKYIENSHFNIITATISNQSMI